MTLNLDELEAIHTRLLERMKAAETLPVVYAAWREYGEAIAGSLPYLIAECRELRQQVAGLPAHRKAYETLGEFVEHLKKENERLRQRLLSAAGDDLCRLTQDEIKQMSAGSVKIPPEDEFLASCKRFHAQMANEVGVMSNCLTLAQMIAENERYRKALEEIGSGGPWGIEVMALAREALGG